MLALFVLTAFAQLGPSSEGEVTLPITTWDGMLGELDQKKLAPPPDIAVAAIDRTIEGSFRKGLFRATLTARFEVLPGIQGHLRVPVLDSRASLGEALLNGKRTSLLRDGNMYSAGVEQPGRYEVKVQFFWGREQDRYARRLRFNLPPAGPTAVRVLVPEQDIDARLVQGALIAARSSADGTRIEGHLDGSGLFDLSWSRRLTHKSQAEVRTEAKLYGVLTIHEALVSGLAVFDVTVLEGETDRVDLSLPEGIEIVGVEGDAVLQWRTEAGPKSQLTVLLRYLVEDQVRVGVRFQFPIEPGKSVDLKLPSTVADTALAGAAGIQAPAGLDVRVEELSGAEALSARDVPPELSDLSSSPLLHAFSFSGAPKIKLAVARHQSVELTSTLIDEIQASTVLIESGLEVTKLKLRIRNNTRQYLTMRLPRGAILTHSLIDGQSVRPAIAPAREEDQGREALLLPLRQSEKIGESGEQAHVVRDGETLTDIANFYYSDPTLWQTILERNPEQLASETDLQVGQTLQIPAKKGAVVEETSFVIEVAYKRPRSQLGAFGLAGIELPDLDVDTVDVTWHLYFPTSLTPLMFSANLTQYSHLRYDPFRRLRGFWDLAFDVGDAWAGDIGKYQSILSRRRGIWKAESDRKSGSDSVLSSFPLVGERYRFKRILLGDERPRIGVAYVSRKAEGWVRWSALLAAIGVGLALFSGRKKPRAVILGAIAIAVLLILGHYFLGVHRRILWGLDLALLGVVGGPWIKGLFTRLGSILGSPWQLLDLLRFKTALAMAGLYIAMELVLAFPLFLSSVAFVLMVFLRWKQARATEVSHV